MGGDFKEVAAYVRSALNELSIIYIFRRSNYLLNYLIQGSRSVDCATSVSTITNICYIIKFVC